jgi:hypothetical protein
MIRSRMLLNINVSPFNFRVTKSHVGRNYLLAVSDANDMHCITVSYYKRRLSTTLRRMNTIIVISTHQIR